MSGALSATDAPLGREASLELAAPRRPRTDVLARSALPLGCAAAWWVIAALHREPPVAAEASYLGLLAAAVLLLALHAAARTTLLQTTAAVLLAAVPWVLPGTPDRGAAAGVLLVGILVLAAASGSASDAFRPPRLVALVLGAQILARSGDLLAPTTADVLGVVCWGVVAAGALHVLAERRSVHAAAIAGAAAFLLGPGFTAMTALALAAPALASLAVDRDLATALRVSSAAALLAPLAWDFERGVLLVLAALAYAGTTWIRATAGLAGLAAFFAPGAARAEGLVGPALILVVVPILVVRPRAELATRFAALCLALGAAAQSSDRAALAVPAVLVATTVGSAGPLASALQRTWTGVLVATVATLAAYPWMRPHALTDAADLLGLGQGWRAGLITLLLLGVAAAASELVVRAAHRDLRPATLAPRALAVLLLPLVLFHLPATATLPIARQPVELHAGSPVWSASLDPPAPVALLRLDSSLSNAAAVPPGTSVAEVRLSTPQGDRVLPLRAGVDTGEWAARRPDVQAIPGFAAPPPFLSWVDAGGRFFGQRYRAQERLEPATTASRVEVRLRPGIPDDLALTVFHLELAR